VVGVNSAIVTRSSGNDGVGFAIPIDMAGTLADNLIKYGKVRRARVGIVLEPLAPAFARQVGLDASAKGVVVGEVMPGSPAAKEEKGKEVEKVAVEDFGLELQPLTDDLAKQFGHKDGKGLLVSGVKAGSPAEAAGLDAGQLITKVVKNRSVQSVSSLKEFES